MEYEILSELAKGPKTLAEVCYRTGLNSYQALHYLQQLTMQQKVKATLFSTDEVWSLHKGV